MHLLLPLVLLLAACAAPRRDGGRAPASVRAARPVPAPGARPVSTDVLRTELERFSARARQERAGVVRGAPMPRAHADAWHAVAATVEAWLPASGREVELVAHVRQALEAELTADARTYGDVPPGLAERLMGVLDALAARLPLPARGEARAAVETEAPPPLSWPLDEASVTSDFGPRRHPVHRRVRMHAGVDLAARLHQPVLAAAPGRVVRVGWNGAHGLQVEMVHAGGLRTRYSHLSHAVVEPGAVLGRGDVLGLAGRTGRTTGVHLHFEVWLHDEPLDPLELLEQGSGGGVPLTVSWRWSE